VDESCYLGNVLDCEDGVDCSKSWSRGGVEDNGGSCVML